jgi:MFS family permease
VVVPCLVVFGLGGLAAMLAPSFPVLLVARFVQGFGAAGLVNLAIVMIGDRYDDAAARAAAIGRNGAVLTTGLAALPLVGGVLVQVGGWRAAFAPYGLALVGALGAARVLPPGRPPGGRTLGQQLRGAGRLLRDPRVAVMNGLGIAGFILVFGAVLTVLPVHLHDRFGVGPAWRGVVIGLPAASAVAVSLRMGRLARRYHTWDLVLAGFAIFAVGFAGAALAPTAPLVAVAMTVYGLGEALVIVTLQTYAAGLAPVGYRGLMVAVWVSAARAGQASGPVLAGLCLDAVGSRGAFLVASAAAALTAGAVAVTRRSVSLTR